jgi:nucleoside-diphosphate-sugar epimerase
MKICVVGGAGFIGHHIVKKFLFLNYEVLVLDNLSTGKIENLPINCQFINCDVSEISVEILTEYLKDVKFVFHLAAKARVQPSIVDPLGFNKINVDATLKLLIASRNAKVKRFIYSASSSVYGDTELFPTPENTKPSPMSPYGLQKYIGEQYCKLFSELYGLDTVSLRYFNVYGEGMLDEGAYCTVLGIFKKQKKNREPLTITNDGNQKRDFTYVGDVVEANYLSAMYSENLNGESFNVGNGKNYSLNEIANLFNSEKIFIGNKVEPYQTLADISKMKEFFGWEPKGDVIKWVKKLVDEI